MTRDRGKTNTTMTDRVWARTFVLSSPHLIVFPAAVSTCRLLSVSRRSGATRDACAVFVCIFFVMCPRLFSTVWCVGEGGCKRDFACSCFLRGIPACYPSMGARHLGRRCPACPPCFLLLPGRALAWRSRALHLVSCNSLPSCFFFLFDGCAGAYPANPSFWASEKHGVLTSGKRWVRPTGVVHHLAIVSTASLGFSVRTAFGRFVFRLFFSSVSTPPAGLARSPRFIATREVFPRCERGKAVGQLAAWSARTCVFGFRQKVYW